LIPTSTGAQIPLAVGFIALAGVAVEIGVLVLSFIDQEVTMAREKPSASSGGKLTPDVLSAAVQNGVAKRVLCSALQLR